MPPLVSILIPAFNVEKWIEEAIRSAVGQSWSRKEIIVVDDGSTDQTGAIVRQLASSEVMVVTQKNQGAAAARNHAYSLCRGDYIQWLDADDFLAPDKIGAQMQARPQSPRALLSSAWGEFIHRPAKAAFTPTALWRDLSPVEWLLVKLRQNIYMSNATWLVTRALTDAAGPWDSRLSLDDDGEYFSRVVLASDGVRFVPEAKAYYRRSSSGSLSHISVSDRKLDSLLLSLELHVEHLRACEDSERVRTASLQFLQRWMIHFYPERLDLFTRAQQLAADLGGQLEVPRLSWKYALIQKMFGWTTAKRTQFHYNEYKSWLRERWDKMLFNLVDTGHQDGGVRGNPPKRRGPVGG